MFLPKTPTGFALPCKRFCAIPHRLLVIEERWVRLDKATSVDADTILMMLQHPEHLRPYHGTALLTLTEQLKGKAPERIFEHKVTETLDTPENRFIKRFMDIVLFLCDELQRLGYWEKATKHQEATERQGTMERQNKLTELREFARFV